ncbi:MAG: ATP-binding protein [Candidatus Riflebacteria bacterium]|nr:ATP-binding protein [Candidatus Riflebacteria bacterium]
MTDIFLERLRRRLLVRIGKLQQQEVDFVVERHGQRRYYQVCYLLASPATVEREFGALETIPDHFPKFVLSMDTTAQPSRRGITWKNLVAFLLEEDHPAPN